jgi:hypothetical protein
VLLIDTEGAMNGVEFDHLVDAVRTAVHPNWTLLASRRGVSIDREQRTTIRKRGHSFRFIRNGLRFESRPDGRMIKRVLVAAFVFAAPFDLVSARDAAVSVDMIGIGAMSCAHWRSTQEHLLEGTVWIYGFWTALNYVAVASGQTQAEINVAAIVADVENTCARQTSQTLASAVWSTYVGSKR